MDDQEITNSILDNSIDVGIDLVEVAIDGFLQDGTIVKDIPIAGIIYSVFRIGMNIREAIFVKNVMVFLQECKNKDENYEKRRKIREEFLGNEKYRIKVTETTITYLNKIENAKKAKFVARVFIALCDGLISYEEYELYVRIIEDLSSFDEINIHKLLEGAITPSAEKSELLALGTISRLKSFGLVDSDQKRGELIKSERDSNFSFSENGLKFARIIT